MLTKLEDQTLLYGTGRGRRSGRGVKEITENRLWAWGKVPCIGIFSWTSLRGYFICHFCIMWVAVTTIVEWEVNLTAHSYLVLILLQQIQSTSNFSLLLFLLVFLLLSHMEKYLVEEKIFVTEKGLLKKGHSTIININKIHFFIYNLSNYYFVIPNSIRFSSSHSTS